MRKNIVSFWLVIFTISMTTTTMNAQPKTVSGDALTSKEQSLITISSLTAAGDLDKLKTELDTGLDRGLTINEIKETLVQLYAYCGFPRSLNAINVFMNLLNERKSKGIVDKSGRDATANAQSIEKYEQGRKVLEFLTKTSQSKPAPGFGEFAPRIDTFLKEHLFADIFGNDIMTYQQRELVTISALAAMPGVDSQLESHVKIGINTGLTHAQLLHAADLIEATINRTQANSLRKVLSVPLVGLLNADMMLRIAELEILPEYLDEYNAILKEESSKSMKIESGVIAILPMYKSEKPTEITIVEIYNSKVAYESHLQTPHFQHYKTTTLKMVKSIRLVGMSGIDPQTIPLIFEKL